MSKAKGTKRQILEAGLAMASMGGLELVTIGGLAKATGMSKSGVFAHFNSKEQLQLDILEYAAEDFADNVVFPTLKLPAGIGRIRNLVERWIAWGEEKAPGGCIFVNTATEFSDRPGKVRDCLLRQQSEWINSLKRLAGSAMRAGDFRPGTDCDQFSFDLYSLLLGFYYYDKLLDNPDSKERKEKALDRLFSQYQ